jgi:hypothetical protein
MYKLILLILTCILLLFYIYQAEHLGGHLRTDRTLWQLIKKPSWNGWPQNGYIYNTIPPRTKWIDKHWYIYSDWNNLD